MNAAVLIEVLRAERRAALDLLPDCPVGSTAYFWCQGRIGTAELALLRGGYPLESSADFDNDNDNDNDKQ